MQANTISGVIPLSEDEISAVFGAYNQAEAEAVAGLCAAGLGEQNLGNIIGHPEVIWWFFDDGGLPGGWAVYYAFAGELDGYVWGYGSF